MFVQVYANLFIGEWILIFRNWRSDGMFIAVEMGNEVCRFVYWCFGKI